MNNKGYIWDSRWIWPYETLYGMLSKFAYINVLHGNSMFDLININGCKKSMKCYYYNKYMVISKYKIDFIKIGDLLEFDVARELLEWVKELLYPLKVKSFPYSFDYAKEQWFRRTFTYCPECMKYGYYSIYHQLVFTQHCFIHEDVHLQETCPSCGEKISYEIQSKRGIIPFSCHCGHRLFEGDTLEIFNLWENPVLKRKKKNLLFRKTAHNYSVILPHDKDSMYWNQLNRGMEKLLEELCVIGKKDMKPHYKFTFADNGREADALKYEMNEKLYFDGMILMKRHIRKLFRIHPNRMAQHALTQGYKVCDIGPESTAYLVWVKMNLGITIIDFIDSNMEVYFNTHMCSSIIDEKVCYNDLTSMRILDRDYPDKWRNIIYDRVVYRVILIKLWKSYQLYLKDIQEKYLDIKDMLLKDFFENYWMALRDSTQVLFNLEDGSGEIWVIDK